MGDIGPIVVDIVQNIANLIIQIIVEGEQNVEAAFTQQCCSALLNKFPYMNVMIVHPDHTQNFQNCTHTHYELPLIWPQTQGYEIYVFTSGSFQLNGDGGYANWCFGRSFNRDGNSVDFNEIPQPPPVVNPPPPPATIPPYPQPRGKDGVFLVNSVKNGVMTSGFAWYADTNMAQNVYPGAYIDIKKDGDIQWEGNKTTGTFQDGDPFWVNVDANAASLPVGSVCGTAANKYRSMTVYRDTWRKLYTVDGWAVFTLYVCT